MDLRHCPFCGSDGAWVATSEDDCGRNASYTVECGNMECGAEIGWHPREADAVQKWNRRVDKYREFFELTMFVEELERIDNWPYHTESARTDSAWHEVGVSLATAHDMLQDLKRVLIDG